MERRAKFRGPPTHLLDTSAAGSAGLSEQEADRLYRELEAAVASICPAWPAGRREDLVQEAMMKVTRIATRSPQSQPLAASYLWRTAYCALVDELRRMRRRSEVALDEAIALEEPPSRLPGPLAAHRSREIESALAACLRQLIKPRRLAVVLYLQGEQAREAAELLGWQLKRVRNLTFRGLEDLRRCLTAAGVTP